MKNISCSLNNVRSRYFMLLACLSLLLATTSCNNDELEFNDSQPSKQYTKAELIEYALSKLPKTRANGDMPVVMVTDKTEVSIFGAFIGPMTIYWGDGAKDPSSNYDGSPHPYTDGEPCHVIFLKKDTPSSAVEELWIDDNGLIYLDIANNTKITTLSCTNNELEMLDFSGCKALEILIASNNKLKSVDMTPLVRLQELHLDENELEYLDISNHSLLHMATLDYNPTKELNVSNTPALSWLTLENLPIEKINHLSIHDSSFVGFPELPKLGYLNISRTPFTSLDISMNPELSSLNVSHSKIKHLNISNGAIGIVYANNSELTNLIYSPDEILNLYTLRIDYTPFEKLSSNLYPLLTSGLPDRNQPDKYNRPLQGYLYTQSTLLVKPFLIYLDNKNWKVINP